MVLFETYLHGFQYFTLSGGRFFVIRALFFGTCVILASCMLIYQTYLNVYAYLQFGVATAVSFEHFAYGSKQTAIDLPAITIYPNNMYLADVVGFTQAFPIPGNPNVTLPNLLTAFVMETSKVPSSFVAVQQAEAQCRSSLPAMRSDMNATGGLGGWITNLGTAYMIQMATQNSINSVVECKWQGKAINCADLFLNRLTDQGQCFTFYPSAGFVQSFSLLNSSLVNTVASPWFQELLPDCYSQTALPQDLCTPKCKEYVNVAFQVAQTQAFGTTLEQINRYNLTTSASGPHSGLQLVLNVQPEQYCVGNTVQNTYGFVAVPHARDVGPILQLSPMVEIPAGFTANIAISVTQITRYTESIGKCKSTYPLKWYPAIPTYSYDACVLQCYALVFDQICNCVPFFAPPYMFSSGHANEFTANGTYIDRFCMYQDVCYTDILTSQNYANYTGIPKGFSRPADFLHTCACPPQCEETQYTTEVSFVPLNSPATFKAMVATGNVSVPTNITEFRKQFAVVNFFYKDVQRMLIVETQAIQIIDVFNGVGGSFGLCLGGSFITLAEVVQFFMKLCERARERRKKAAERNTRK